MKTLRHSFYQMLYQLRYEPILILISFTPFLIGIIFHYLIPIIETIICTKFHLTTFFAPYYQLLDIFLILLIPNMFQYVVALFMLEEIDNHTSSYLIITPLGKTGYLLSRIGIVSILTFPLGLLIPILFSLTSLSIITIFIISSIATIHSIIIVMLILSFSSNKVEGIAIGKIATLLLIGACIPYVLTTYHQYLFSFLPTFWITKAIINNFIYYLPAFLISCAWIGILYKRFSKKI